MTYDSFTTLIGSCDTLFKVLLIFIGIDYITGILKAIYNKKLNSGIGAKGIIKKIGYILIVIVAGLLDTLLNSPNYIRNIICYMFITNEGISIIENWANMGINIPNFLREKLDSMSNNNDIKK